MKEKIIGVSLIILASLMIFFLGMDVRVAGNPIQVFQVYLNGEKIGYIYDRDELYDLIDREQSELKEKYNVDKVYPPNGLDVKKVYTYNNDIKKAEYIYNVIKDQEPFTIEGYVATITYTEEKIINGVESSGIPDPKEVYLLNKEDMKEALYNTATVFIGTEELKDWEKKTQSEITDIGERIESVYFQETLTIRKDLISTKEYIFTDSEELSQYLLFGTLEKQKTYTTKLGENLESIADRNKLNIEELLIANPQYPSANVLLTAGEVLNVGLINPLVSVVYRKTIVDDVEIKYKTEYINDNKKYTNYKQVTTKGENGKKRVTQDVVYLNGEVQSLIISKQETLKNVVNEVITRGTKKAGGGYYYYDTEQGNDSWSWPTISPFYITSRFKWRWGRQHAGIDISGTGHGSPIYSIQAGTVIRVNTDRSKAEGLSVHIDHHNGYYSVYMHLSKILVKNGQEVKRATKIGKMGNTGRSTGTHLHLGIYKGAKPYGGGVAIDPCGGEVFIC